MISSAFVLLTCCFHFVYGVVECLVFPQSQDVQKQFMGKYCDSKEALRSMKTLLFNFGCYHFMSTISIFYGWYIQNNHLVSTFLYIFLSNGIFMQYSSPISLGGALGHAIPPMLALIAYEI
jgi:uncharacterized membrane protein